MIIMATVVELLLNFLCFISILCSVPRSYIQAFTVTRVIREGIKPGTEQNVTGTGNNFAQNKGWIGSEH